MSLVGLKLTLPFHEPRKRVRHDGSPMLAPSSALASGFLATLAVLGQVSRTGEASGPFDVSNTNRVYGISLLEGFVTLN